jgi:beta-lactamase regulating signal transducer with metallopeptidase domain
VAEAAWRLGLGVALAWAALPLFVRLARRSQQASPAAYYRALVVALAMATALVLAPLARPWVGVGVRLPSVISDELWTGSSTMTFVAEWVTPLLVSAQKPGSAAPLALVFSGIGGAWLLLLGAGVARSLWGRLELWRTYRGAAQAPPGVIVHAQRVAAELGIRAPALRVAEGLASAFTFGLFSPVVVLGAAACHGREDELDFTLRHELLHVARSDTRMAFVIDLAQRCFTGHPCLARLAAEIRFAREARVDELAAGSVPLEYARFLLALAERLRSAHAPAPALVSMADTSLERRVTMLMKSTNGTSQRWPGAGWLGLSGLLLGALVFLAPSSWGQGSDAGADQLRVEGNLTAEQITSTAYGEPYQGQFIHECYSQLSYPRPNLGMRLLFEIDENGHVSSGRAEVPQHPELAPCIEGVLKRMVFPKPSSGTVRVDMPGMLTPMLEERQARAEADQGRARLSKEVIREVVRTSYERVRTCYEALPRPLPAVTLKLEFTIGRDGTVIDGQVESKEYPGLAACLDGIMRSLVFPAPKTGIVTVVYPIIMSP